MILRKNLLVAATCIALLLSQSARSSCQHNFDEFRNEIRTERDKAAAHDLLNCVESTYRYNEIYQVLRIALNENTHYPIPNELLDTILSKFSNPDENDMSALADSITRFRNEHYDEIEAAISFINHKDLDATGLYKVVQYVAQTTAQQKDIEHAKRERLFTAIKATELYQSEDLLSESFREAITTNLTILAFDKNGKIDSSMEGHLFEHIKGASDDELKDLVTGIHKGNITFDDNQKALHHIVASSQCNKQCQSRIIQLITYNEDLTINDRDKVLIEIANRPDTTDYILGDLTMAAWDARVPLKDPLELLRQIGDSSNFGAQAELKMKQALEQLHINGKQEKVY